MGPGVAEDSEAHLAWGRRLGGVVACQVLLSQDLIHFNKHLLSPAMLQDLCWELSCRSARTNTDPLSRGLGSGRGDEGIQ